MHEVREAKQSKITQVWNKANEYLKGRDYESAYRLILDKGDDMYLLRLIVQTKPVISSLQLKTAKRVLSKLNKFNRDGIFEQIEIDWIDDARKTGLFQQLERSEKNELMDTLD